MGTSKSTLSISRTSTAFSGFVSCGRACLMTILLLLLGFVVVRCTNNYTSPSLHFLVPRSASPSTDTGSGKESTILPRARHSLINQTVMQLNSTVEGAFGEALEALN